LNSSDAPYWRPAHDPLAPLHRLFHRGHRNRSRAGVAGIGGDVNAYTVHVGDCLASLRAMPAESVSTCVTSPPYFGLRDYGHEGQIGLEDTPEAYVARLVEVFREVRRVLRDDGTLWLNLGDSYGATGGDIFTGFNARYSGTGLDGGKQAAIAESAKGAASNARDTGLRPKNLLGIPWRVAFALQADGWYLRQDIIWHKPNPMPESVTDRCTKAHEYIFLLSKSPRYYFDQEAVKEAGVIPAGTKAAKGSAERAAQAGVNSRPPEYKVYDGTRNRRSVWTVSTKPYSGAHFATFPPDLIEPCVLAGCPVGGTVLDPFGGSGTTAGVAIKHGRSAVLCELNPDYAALIHDRVSSIAGGLFARAAE
jgi:DNA modification methylase